MPFSLTLTAAPSFITESVSPSKIPTTLPVKDSAKQTPPVS
jgi:hypothetical protein